MSILLKLTLYLKVKKKIINNADLFQFSLY